VPFALIRRAAVSVEVHLIQLCRNKRHTTLRAFFNFIAAHQARKAFSLATTSRASGAPP
jgi:hypothetical protein